MTDSHNHFDVAIAGAGPAGIALSCYLKKAGHTVILFEQSTFPRHQIGESLLPFSWRVFDEIGFSEELKKLNFVKKFGAWFHSERSKSSRRFLFEDSLNPVFESICHVDRAKFDDSFLSYAKHLGVVVRQPESVREIEKNDGLVKINGIYTARVLARSSGIGTATVYPDNYVRNSDDDNATAVYSYFKYSPKTNTQRDGDILIDLFYENPDQKVPSWGWAIPISDSTMSVGFVVRTPSLVKFRGEQTLDLLGRSLMKLCPKISEVVACDNSPLEQYRMRHNFQRVAKNQVFDQEILIGDAAGFIDPVFSSGVHIALNSARMAFQTLDPLLKEPSTIISKASLLPFESEYKRLFWGYYRFVKYFYQKNIVEQFFLMTNPREDDDSVRLRREFTSILSGDIDTPNRLVSSLDTARLDINPEVRRVFATHLPELQVHA